MLNKNAEKQILSLPIYKYENDIVDQIKKNKVLIIMGETGCGKTTQIGKIIHNKISANSCICITQPRRVAAISIAHRVAEETNTKIGGLVGYSVRFKEQVSRDTKIKFVTDGMLVRECLLDNQLKKYSFIILDEVHERTIHTDILLFVIKNLLESKQREDLKVIIMSATLNPQKFLSYFDTKCLIQVHGRAFPVKIYNVLKDNPNYIDMSLSCILRILLDKNYPMGDILVFLPGQEDIEDLEQLLKSKRLK